MLLLLTGDALFQTHENLEHLAMMEAVLGPLPQPLVAAAASNVRDLFKRWVEWGGGRGGAGARGVWGAEERVM